MRLNELYCYFINPDHYIERRAKMAYILKQGFKKVRRIAYNGIDRSKIITMSKAHSMALEKAITKNEFPVLILEDDAALMKDLPDEFSLKLLS